jgi:hypothetical protein
MAQSYPARDIWGMFPVTTWLVEKRPDHMEADPSFFGQAQQGQMLGQLPPQQYVQQYVPVGQTTSWEIEERKKSTLLPSIEYGGIRMGESVPIVVTPFDELEKRYGTYERAPFMGSVAIKIPPQEELDKPFAIMQSNPWAGINLKPLGLGGRQVPLRMAQFDAAPLSEGEVASRQPYAMVDPLSLAYTTGAYIRPGAPEFGRFPVMPPGITYRV